jgi:tetratricopeptide (TPR) repeat protein
MIVSLALLSPVHRTDAQALTLKRTLTQGAAPGCPAATPVPMTRRDNAEARRLSAAGQEAALVGDKNAARDAFLKAAALNPTDERIAYDLARAHEDLSEVPAAVREYCRYLSLAAAGPQAADVRARLSRIAPRDAIQASERALDQFRVGVSNYDRSRFDVALQSFDDVVRAAPQATEALFNRAVVRIALGRREDAARDLQAYLAADPSALDRLVVTQAIESLRRPSFNAGEAFRLGLLPGFGQFYTRRPALGVLVIAGVAGATAAALYERTDVRLVDYVDPNGIPVPYEEEFTERPYLVPAIATAAVVTLGAAFEAYRYARGTQRAVPIEPARGVRTGLSFNDAPVEFAPHIGARGQVGLGLFARF